MRSDENTATNTENTNTDADNLTEIDTTLESIGVDTLVVDTLGQVTYLSIVI